MTALQKVASKVPQHDAQPDWTRIEDVLRRIRILRLDIRVDKVILRKVASHIADCNLQAMPRLKQFIWDQSCSWTQYLSDGEVYGILSEHPYTFWTHILPLLGPHFNTLTDLDLKHRSYFNRDDHRDGGSDLPLTFHSQMVNTQWGALTILSTEFAMSTATIISLGRSPILRELHCTASSDQLADIAMEKGPFFAALERFSLDIKGFCDPSDWADAHDFLSFIAVHAGNLWQLTVKLHEHEPADDDDMTSCIGEISSALALIKGLRCIELVLPITPLALRESPFFFPFYVPFSAFQPLYDLKFLTALYVRGLHVLISPLDVPTIPWPFLEALELLPSAWDQDWQALCGGMEPGVSCPVELAARDLYAIAKSHPRLSYLAVQAHTQDCALGLPPEANWTPQLHVGKVIVSLHDCVQPDLEVASAYLKILFPNADICSADDENY